MSKIVHPRQIRSSILPLSFYSRPTLEVAQDILGKYFVKEDGKGILSGFIVEVEAYHQDGDEAAHTYNGKTERNSVMFGEAGHLYVYFTYGMHYCMNVVTETIGTGAAVLIRAIEPVLGISRMQKNRGRDIPLRDLTNGPAKSCKAFDIDRTLNGTSLRKSNIKILDSEGVPSSRIERSKRIGIKKSTELLWRFTVKDNYFLSRSHGKERLYREL